MYTSDALAREIQRALERSKVHSVCITGRDALANEAFLVGCLTQLKVSVPVMLDTDGQRPAALEALQPYLALVQVSIATSIDGAAMERVVESLKQCARLGVSAAVAITGHETASDSDYLRVVESVAGANGKTMIVLHPSPAEEHKPLERRWSMLMEQATAVQQDVRLALKLNGPVTPR
jgi:pyruvate-formate lyase-activating enzyme